eukprot:15240817-Alexandrium_andersonii.AAC.1
MLEPGQARHLGIDLAQCCFPEGPPAPSDFAVPHAGDACWRPALAPVLISDAAGGRRSGSPRGKW